MAKVSEAQKRASRKWEKKNKTENKSSQADNRDCALKGSPRFWKATQVLIRRKHAWN